MIYDFNADHEIVSRSQQCKITVEERNILAQHGSASVLKINIFIGINRYMYVIMFKSLCWQCPSVGMKQIYRCPQDLTYLSHKIIRNSVSFHFTLTKPGIFKTLFVYLCVVWKQSNFLKARRLPLSMPNLLSY